MAIDNCIDTGIFGACVSLPLADRVQSSRDKSLRSPPVAKRPTLKTIAAIANLGVTTVSRALKDGDDIAAETKRRVREIATEIGYRPNRAGLRLRTGTTQVVSLVLNPHDEVSRYGTSMITGISQVLRDTDFHLVVTPHFLQVGDLEPVRQIVESGAADGLILSRTQPQDVRVKYLLENGIPFVTHGRTELATPHAYHDFDNDGFAFEAARRLIAKGRRRLMLIGPPAHLTYHTHMMTGLHRAVRSFGVESVVRPGIDLDLSAAAMRETICALGHRNDCPDGFICGGDTSAVALIAGLHDAGLVLGDKVDVIAKQTADTLDHWVPAVDTIYEDLTATGRTLAALLVDRIDGKPADALQSVRQPQLRYRT